MKNYTYELLSLVKQFFLDDRVSSTETKGDEKYFYHEAKMPDVEAVDGESKNEEDARDNAGNEAEMDTTSNKSDNKKSKEAPWFNHIITIFFKKNIQLLISIRSRTTKQ